ncbi:ABC transporter permease [[Clostridium] polysaccharolyticum]|uniref:Peptide/nickel transport system permease protein n=1 Tax=[Clostridium] polysaccharolyticum TaxID=29364 RepID=A0A1H9ZB46_9FIRM|nr:ABC transporter permease [[Clostridium] polysaccharolyticum]SES78542.1 peptide/nickel transport system permease protein [[Clostridium] polysaccharolyticum]
MKKSKKFIIGIVMMAVVFGIVLVGIFYTPYDPNKMNGSMKNMPPSLKHWFGTDNFGRDILSRVMDGSKTTFLIAVFTVVSGGAIGSIIGALTGYFGGIFDTIVMRLNDVLLSFPYILLGLVVISFLGIGKYNIVIAMGILFIPSFARVIRSEYVTQKEQDYVKNARLMGASHIRIIFVHILPNTLPILLSSVTIGFNNAVLTEAALSFLGLGVQPPDASLGRMLAEAQAYLMNAPWYALAPGGMIILTVLAFSLINERE